MTELYFALNYLRTLARTHVGAHSERGATAVEYAIVVGFIAAVVVFGVTALGNNTNKNFRSASGAGLH